MRENIFYFNFFLQVKLSCHAILVHEIHYYALTIN
jgi:hypothetical protein